MRYLLGVTLIILLGFVSCRSQQSSGGEMLPGARQTGLYLPELEGKRVAVVANHTSLVKEVHLVDTLLSEGIEVRKIFSPEHGFRGEREAGELIGDYRDDQTGLPVVSLYGSSKKPEHGHLDDVDVVVFDIQDVGVRFYTYISTMHYVMEACAETNTKFMVLDRPNPNGFYVDGPLLDTQYRSFVGMHPIPLVHGMTIAELGRMINDQGWLKNGVRCDYEWIACKNYTHDSLYHLPVPPSPNLPDMRSVYLYPSLGLMEGTVINVGRGTEWPFQVFGHPQWEEQEITYVPRPIKGVSENPKFKNQAVHGIDLRDYPIDSLTRHPRIRLEWIRQAMDHHSSGEFFLPFFMNLTGSKKFMQQLKQGVPITEIRKSWEDDLETFRKLRSQYLIYEE